MAITEKDVLQEEDLAVGPVSSGSLPAVQGRGRPKKQPQQAGAAPVPPTPAPVPPAPVAPARVRKFKIPTYVYWMLLCVVLLVAGFWLVQNPWVVTDNINQPYALLAGPALLLSGLAFWLIVKFFAAIERGIKSAIAAFKAARAKDEGAQFFWMVIAVFLAVSVFASGDFFSKLEHEAIPGMGYATAFVIDLVAVVCMRARLSAGRMRDKAGQTLYLVGVLGCAGASAFANLYTTLTTFNTATSGSLPPWMANAAPWFGVVFPALIVLLSLTADYTLDQTSSKLDPESYREQESKRVRMRQYQRDLLRERVAIEQDIDDLSAQLLGRKEKRTFFLIAWLFPLQMGGKQLLAKVEALYQPQIVALTEQNEALRGQLVTLASEAQGAYNGLLQAFQGLQAMIDGQRDTDNRLIADRFDALALDLRSVAPATEVEILAAELRREMKSMVSVTEVEDLAVGLHQEVRSMASASQVEDLARVLRQEMSVLAPAVWVEELSERMNTLVPTSQIDKLTSTLRQEMRSLTSSKVKLNYAELAKSLAPLVVKEQRLNEVSSEVVGEVSGDTEEIPAVSLETLPPFDEDEDEDETSSNDGVEDASEATQEAWLQQPTVTVQQAAVLVGHDAKYVRTLRDRGALKAASRNKRLITTASIKAYRSKRSVKA